MREPGIPRCEQCGYDLSGLRPEEEPKCSECGQIQTIFLDQRTISGVSLAMRMTVPFFASVVAGASLMIVLSVLGRGVGGLGACLIVPLLAVVFLLGPALAIDIDAARRRPDGIVRSPSERRMCVLGAWGVQAGSFVAFAVLTRLL